MEKSSSNRTLVTVIATAVILICTVIVTVFVAREFFAESLCASRQVIQPRLTFNEKAEWEQTERLHIDEKGVTVMRTADSDRCYVMPINRDNEKRTLSLIHDPLSDEMLEQIGGPYAVDFCDGQPVYMLKDIHQAEASRAKRQAPVRASGLDKEYDERTPRCMDLVLDCSADGAIGQTQDCYTYINGVILMKQECTSENTFKIYMSKPPGRILKIAQQQWKICIARRSEGLRC